MTRVNMGLPLIMRREPTIGANRAALKWLEAQGLEHKFHDLRKDGVDAAAVRRWADAVGWDVLLNKRGTTWRGLEDGVKDATTSANAAAWTAPMRLTINL